MSVVMRLELLLVLCSLIVAAPSLWASWFQDGILICREMWQLEYPQITSDGAGGAIVAWSDLRNLSDYDVYVQRVDASGVVQWAADGVPICTATEDQRFSTITSDGAGGAIVAWWDLRSGNEGYYAQRVNASGAVQWEVDGVPLCTIVGGNPIITSDGAGGAIVAWGDAHGGDDDIYAQCVNSSGVVQWAADGVALCTATGDQWLPKIISDGAGGAIVTWMDFRSGYPYGDIYAQRVDASGAVQWTADGVALCTDPENQWEPTITSDGAGGAIVAWEDDRYIGIGGPDIYAQRVDASGAVQWTVGGVALCTATEQQTWPKIASDDAGGAIITWQDERGGYGNEDIYAQRVNSSGAVQWTADGVALCTAMEYQNYPTITSDGAGGAIVAWIDDRIGGDGIYAQRVSSSGAVQWTANGVALRTGGRCVWCTDIISDGAGGAVVTWQDLPPGAGEPALYGQFIDSQGRTGPLAPDIYSVRDVPGDQGGMVYLSWYATRLDVFMDSEMSHYSIWRAISPTGAAVAIEDGAASLYDLSKLDTANSAAVIRIENAGALTYFWELVETVAALYMEAYGKPVVTLFDSTAVCDEYHYFQVVAHTTDPTVFWKSAPDSGYSVDNLAPCPPLCLAGEQSYEPEGLQLTWSPNTEADLYRYAVYRGTHEHFIPETPIASLSDTAYFDSDWCWDGGYYYKLSAIDIHGNESDFAVLGPDEVTGTDVPKAPHSCVLYQNTPNPFNPSTTIRFDLPRAVHVKLSIYNVKGEPVSTIVDEHMTEGCKEISWTATNDSGSAVASGIYFYRLIAGDFVQTKKMVLLR